MSKQIRYILITLAVLAVLAGALIFALNYDPADGGEEQTPTAASERLFDLQESDVTEVRVTNEKGTLTFALSADGSIVLNGDDTLPLASMSVQSAFYSFPDTRYTEVVSEDGSASLAEYGLDSPAARVEMTAGDTVYTYLCGSVSPLNGGVYGMIEGETRILLLEDATYAADYGLLDYITKAVTPSISTGDTEKTLTSLRIGGSARGDVLELERKSDEEQEKTANLSPYRILSPREADANADQLEDKIIGKLSSLRPSGAYAVYPTGAELAACGLEQPAYTLDYTYDGQSYSYRIGGTDESGARYMTVEGYDVIYLVDESAIAFLDTKTDEVISKILYLRYIDSFDWIRLETADEEITIETTGDMDNLIAKVDGTIITTDAFQKAYQLMIGALTQGAAEKPDSAPLYAKITFKLRDSETTDVLAFYTMDARKLYAEVNGVCHSYVMKGDIDDMIAAVLNLRP